MNNDPEVSAQLHRLADAEPLPDFDTNAVLTRGRSGLRRRRFLSAGGGIAGVAAIALAATLIPNLSSAGQDPGVAGTENSQFESVPGLPHGEAALFVDLSLTQARQLCALRYTGEQPPFRSTGKTLPYVVGEKPSYQMKVGTATPPGCQIPGGDRPSAKLIAAAAADPLPTTPAGLLRNCSVQTWVDVTGWRIMASDVSKATGKAEVVALSPSGRSAVACEIDHRPAWDKGPLAKFEMTNSLFLRLKSLDPNRDPILTPASGSKWAELLAGGGGVGSCDDKTKKCRNDSIAAWGRGPAETASVEVSLRGKSYRVPATDGWWASTWQASMDDLSGTKKKPEWPVYKAYDKHGKFLKQLGG